MSDDITVNSYPIEPDLMETDSDVDVVMSVTVTFYDRWSITATKFRTDEEGVSETDVVRLCDAVSVAAQAMFT